LHWFAKNWQFTLNWKFLLFAILFADVSNSFLDLNKCCELEELAMQRNILSLKIAEDEGTYLLFQ